MCCIIISDGTWKNIGISDIGIQPISVVLYFYYNNCYDSVQLSHCSNVVLVAVCLLVVLCMASCGSLTPGHSLTAFCLVQ